MRSFHLFFLERIKDNYIFLIRMLSIKKINGILVTVFSYINQVDF